jgi:hypothetical protein
MGSTDDDGGELQIEEIIIPVIAWSLICGQYVYLWRIGAFQKQLKSSQGDLDAGRYFSYSFFAQCREGWVAQNHLTGQAAANSTRSSTPRHTPFSFIHR